MRTLRIAVAQPVVTVDAAENGAAVRRMMRAAADQGARLVHFPEGMLSGYAVAQHEDWDDVDWSVVREQQEAVAALAGELSVWVVLGSAHRLTPPNRPHNSLYVIDDAGRLVDRYKRRGVDCLLLSAYPVDSVLADLDRDGPSLDIALNYARPWRAAARSGEIYGERRVTDARSAARTEF